MSNQDPGFQNLKSETPLVDIFIFLQDSWKSRVIDSIAASVSVLVGSIYLRRFLVKV